MPITEARALTRVAVGLLVDRDSRVFITRRPEGAHQGGKWEFPGGKIDDAEDPYEALCRELHEEVEVEVTDAEPFMQLSHRYPEKTVLLEVWRVRTYRGEPHGREGQAVRWSPIVDLDPEDFPAADRLILRKLQLPPLYLISDAATLGVEKFLTKLEEALAAGARLVQMREPSMEQEPLRVLSARAATLCRRFGAKILLNETPELALALGADGVHLNRHRLKAMRARPLPVRCLVGASCHDAEELAAAAACGADFAVLSPVAPTASHPEAKNLGWGVFGRLAASTPLPLYALGGMRPAHASAARAHGAQGLAMLSGVWQTERVAGVVAAVLAGFKG